MNHVIWIQVEDENGRLLFEGLDKLGSKKNPYRIFGREVQRQCGKYVSYNSLADAYLDIDACA